MKKVSGASTILFAQSGPLPTGSNISGKCLVSEDQYIYSTFPKHAKLLNFYPFTLTRKAFARTTHQYDLLLPVHEPIMPVEDTPQQLSNSIDCGIAVL